MSGNCNKSKLFIFILSIFGYCAYKSIFPTQEATKYGMSQTPGIIKDYSTVLNIMDQNERVNGFEETEAQNVLSKPFQAALPGNPIYIDAKPFLKAKPYHDDVMFVQPMMFLTDVKNPCFALTKDYINVGNINLSFALKNNLEIRCLPYAYQAGFTKSGTADLFYKSSKHRLFSGGTKNSDVHSPDGEQIPMGNIKEAHFWDNMYCKENNTFDVYSRMYHINPIANSYRAYGPEPLDTNKLDDYRDLLYLDGTPRTVWHGDTWDEDANNHGLQEPKILLPHKIHHVNPNTKIIIIMRNPTSRLFSDYQFYYFGKDKSPEHFHIKVLDAIMWWKRCVEKYPVRTCAYGKAPPGLDELGFEICMRNKTNTGIAKRDFGSVCQSKHGWTLNAADRLRVSMYYIFVKDWLEIFPRENFLFVKFEDYIKNPYEYIESNIYPFLGIPKLSLAEKDKINAKSGLVHNQNKKATDIKMLQTTTDILNEFYKDSKTSLAQLLNDDRFLWEN